MKIFLSPHNDDETLFGAFTLLRERPLVVIAYDGHSQGNRGLSISASQRRLETVRALRELDIPEEDIIFLGYRDDWTIPSSKQTEQITSDIQRRFYRTPSAVQLGIVPNESSVSLFKETFERLYVPAYEVNGHPQHNICSQVYLKDVPVTRYMTYTTEGKSISPNMVPILEGWIPKKLRALACYESQMTLDPRCGCYPHFLRDQNEYYA